jgi:hypothetical protein
MTRSQRYAALTEQRLRAAESGADRLVKLIQEGAIRGRDLAVTVGILIDKVGVLEQRQSPPSTSVGELLRRPARYRGECAGVRSVTNRESTVTVTR